MKILKSLFFLLSLLAVGFSNCKKDEKTPAAEVKIIVGEGITGLKIGATAQAAIDIYGAGSKSYGGVGGQYTHFVSYLDKGIDVYLETSTSETFSASQKSTT